MTDTTVQKNAEAKELPSVAVRKIYETVDEYCTVSVDQNSFALIRGFRPQMEYKTQRNAAGQGVRIFQFANAIVYSRYNKEDNRQRLIMKVDEAKANVRTLEEERAGEEVLPTAL